MIEIRKNWRHNKLTVEEWLLQTKARSNLIMSAMPPEEDRTEEENEFYNALKVVYEYTYKKKEKNNG